MISDKTLERIWSCRREIEAGKKILLDMQEAQKKLDDWHEDKKRTEPTLKDAFGRKRHLQLGVPSSNDGHRLFDVSPLLAETIITSHIAKKQAELVEANEQARIELSALGA